MCLTAKKFQPFLITLRKRKIYKVLMKSKLDGKLCTPYRFAEVNMDDRTIKASGRIEISHPLAKYKCIDGGMIHSFTDELSASSCALHLTYDYNCWNRNDNLVVYEALIPPFTLYLKGNNGNIVSRRIKLIKEVI